MIEIILGPPGTGKTTTLLGIVDEELARGVAPDKIGYVTFTRRGAEVAISRAATKFSVPRSNFPFFRTLHSLCFRALGMRNSDVMEKDKLQEFADYAGVKITGRWADDGSFSGYATGDRILFMENLARMKGVTLREQYETDEDNLSWNTVEHVSRCLSNFKKTHGLSDYTDMLLDYVREDRAPGLDVLLVDEAQDLSRLQWRVVDLLKRSARRVVVVGDDDQAIYRWAGADVDYLIGLEGSVRVLEQSYRVPSRVQGLAESVIGRLSKRRAKVYSPRPTLGLLDRVSALSGADLDWRSEKPEPNMVPTLILARNQYILKEQVEPELRGRGIVYEMNGRSSIKPSILSAVSDWEKLRTGEALNGAQVAGIYKFLTVSVGVKTGAKAKIERLKTDDLLGMGDLVRDYGLLVTDIWHEALDRLPPEEMSYMLAARRGGQKLMNRAQVHLSTIHGAKGGEADHVILYSEMARRTFIEMNLHEDDEARVYYVGVTRARERLTIVGSSTKQYYPHV